MKARCDWQPNVDLTHENTLRLPVKAQWFSAPTTLTALQYCVRQAHAEGTIYVLGGGSNVLLPERLNGRVIHPALKQWWLEAQGNDVLAHVGAGVNWHALVMALAEKGLWGIENLALIPGDCGAAPVQNIGAYGVELADVLDAVQVMYLADGSVDWLTNEACGFGYRDSIFKNALQGKVIITRLILRLKRHAEPKLGYGDLSERVGGNPSSADVAHAVCQVRQEKLPDPAELANAGSFFKNPLVSAKQAEVLLSRYPALPHFAQPDGTFKLAAGWLIDQCGLKGVRFGAFGVHERQALVLVHFGGGDRAALLDVADHVVATVKARFGVALEVEPRIL
ncbi:UDP-N-acetylmuramate dehydrogenase [Vreelandella aquamarina]